MYKVIASETYNYETEFNLSVPVNDINAAQEYLIEDDMTKYLTQSIKREANRDKIDNFSDAIVSIKWLLYDEQSGVIRLQSSRLLNQDELDFVSSWILGQNSDGLGEGFEQQEFAWMPYDDDDDDDDYYNDNYYNGGEMASFDWQTNNYKLHLVK